MRAHYTYGTCWTKMRTFRYDRSEASPESVRLADRDIEWLMSLMDVPSVSPLEGGDLDTVRSAQEIIAQGAAGRGYLLLRCDSPPPDRLDGPETPTAVREQIAQRADFLDAQPSLVLSIGSRQPVHRRIVINFHVDTVGPHVPPKLVDGHLWGRGAVDDKGPGIAALVGVSAAFVAQPWLADEIEVQVVSVPGEEGGAMGVYGTRWLVESGCAGRLMIFAEPTGSRVIDTVSATMTPRLQVAGSGATDDRPANGHNATLALGYLAEYLALRLGSAVHPQQGRVCIAGLRTGDQHNRVYGTGRLLLNIAYHDSETGERLALLVEDSVRQARDQFAARFADIAVARRLIEDWDDVVSLDWLKRGLPALTNRDPDMEALLARCGLHRSDGIKDETSFTCDAIWAQKRGMYTAVCGPGDLGVNGAHTLNEQVAISDLESYSTRIRNLVIEFGRYKNSNCE